MFRLEQLLKVLDPDPVLVDQRACLRVRHARSGCRGCSAACPEQAIRIQGRQVALDAARCNRCGLCVSACPTGAVSLRGIDEAALLAGARVHCSRAGGEGAGLPCLGLLTPDHLIAMSLSHDNVTLMTGDCEACPLAAGGRAAEAAVKAAASAIQALGRTASIRTEQSTPAARVVSRRELLSLWRTEGAQVASQLLPESGVHPSAMSSRVPKRRSAWIGRLPADAVATDSAMPDGPWAARTAAETCTGCAICVLFCPTGALTQQRDESAWRLMHQPAACVNCNTCEELCPADAIGRETLQARTMATGETRHIKTITT